jgi:hypothetical protein
MHIHGQFDNRNYQIIIVVTVYTSIYDMAVSEVMLDPQVTMVVSILIHGHP